jgi:hypothetical protein
MSSSFEPGISSGYGPQVISLAEYRARRSSPPDTGPTPPWPGAQGARPPRPINRLNVDALRSAARQQAFLNPPFAQRSMCHAASA